MQSFLTKQSFRAQMRLKCTIEGALAQIEKECGFVGSIIVGGPEPRCGGDLVVMSCVRFSLIVVATILIISRAHTGTTRLGLNFSQVHSGWKAQMEEPFIGYLDSVFRASPFFFYTLTYINNHPAHEVRRALALPNTVTQGDLSQGDLPPLASILKQYHSCARINSDATEFAGAPEGGPDEPFDTTAYENSRRTLEDKNLYHFGDSDSQSEGSVNSCILYLQLFKSERDY
jgi:hypothetical protein